MKENNDYDNKGFHDSGSYNAGYTNESAYEKYMRNVISSLPKHFSAPTEQTENSIPLTVHPYWTTASSTSSEQINKSFFIDLGASPVPKSQHIEEELLSWPEEQSLVEENMSGQKPVSNVSYWGEDIIGIVKKETKNKERDFYSMYINKCIRDSSKVLGLRVRFGDLNVLKDGSYIVEFNSDHFGGHFTVKIKSQEYILTPNKFEKILIHHLTKTPFESKFIIENKDLYCDFNEYAVKCLEACIPYILKAGKRSTFEWIEPIQDKVLELEDRRKREKKKKASKKKNQDEDENYIEDPQERVIHRPFGTVPSFAYPKAKNPLDKLAAAGKKLVWPEKTDVDIRSYVISANNKRYTIEKRNEWKAKAMNLVHGKYGKNFSINFDNGKVYDTRIPQR